MLFGLAMLDYGVLVLFWAVLVGVGLYFRNEQETTGDYLLGGRSLSGFPLGLSLTTMLVGGMAYLEMPSQAYNSGLKLLALPLAVWIVLPLATRCVLPLYHGLGLCSICEYLEYRFDLATRVTVSAATILWRLAWLAGLLSLPCQLLAVATGGILPAWLLVVVLGLTVTAYTSLGGIQAVVWTDVIQTLLMLAGIFLVVATVWASLDGGVQQVWRVAEVLGRPSLGDLRVSWTEPWKFWSLLPGFLLLTMFFYTADQVTLQRSLTAKSLKAARRSFLWNSLCITVMAPALAYSGLCLLAYYQTHPQAMRPIWVANVDSVTRRSITFPETRDKPLFDDAGRPRTSLLTGEVVMDPTSGKPLIDWDRDTLDASTVTALVAEGRILRPNSKEPFPDVADLLDQDTGQLRIDPLAMRWQDEVILHERAQPELLAHYPAQPLPLGLAGLILAAILTAVMCVMDSGIHAVGTLLIIDFHRRLGFGRRWLTGRVQKDAAELNERDEMVLAKPLLVVVGAIVTLLAWMLTQTGHIWPLMIVAMNVLGGPLLAVFLLGIFTRRCTGRGGLVSLIVGMCLSLWLLAVNRYQAVGWTWPFDEGLAESWTMAFVVAMTMGCGYVLSLFWGRTRSKAELRGLVVGVGQLGKREPERIETISVKAKD